MVERYEYFYRVGYCKIDNKECHRDGLCDTCLWAELDNRRKDLNAQETPNCFETEMSDCLESSNPSSAEKVKGEE